MANLAEVKERLNGKVRTPEIVPARNGSLWIIEDGVWRLMTVLPGRPPGSPTPEVAAEASRVLGMFHRSLKKNPPRLFQLPAAEHNRDCPAPPESWDTLMSDHRASPDFERASAALEKGRSLAGSLPEIEGTTYTVLHGDPKLDNFLFDEKGTATGLIDLDLVRKGFLIWEMADALRSWTSLRKSKDVYKLGTEIFRASVFSYKTHGLELTAEEWGLLPAATAAMTLNLARRYFQDFFSQNYFIWDKAEYSSLAEQNLNRGTALLSLAEDLREKELELKSFINS